MSRKAKIVATLGPSSNTVEQISELIKSGIDIARVNMSHGTHEGHREVISNIRKASALVGKEIGILVDLQGPKIRVDKLDKPLKLSNGEVWYLGASEFQKDYKNFIPTVYKDLVKDANPDSQILFDDGLLEAKVLKKYENVLEIKILQGGDLKSNKGINLPDCKVSAPSLTEKDEKDLYFGLEEGADFIALSFVRTADDVQKVKFLLHKVKSQVPVIAKIEKPEAVSNIVEIIEATDVIMIARGDMGVEVGNHLVPAIQKKIINLCNIAGKPVITATQMLESMIENSRPTRAEASDVANAIWDGTDAVMLSGESAAGAFPVESVKMMGKIVEEAEQDPKERPLLRHMDLKSVSASIQVAASLIAEKTYAKWIISVTQSGSSCLKMSRFRPKTPVLGLTNSIEVVRKMNLYWGITPYLLEQEDESLEDVEVKMLEHLQEKKLVGPGDKVVITRGDGQYFVRRSSNSIKVEMIKRKVKPKNQDHIEEANFDSGKILLDTQVCSSCQNCISICPHHIWEHSEDNERKTQINKANAKNCAADMACVEACPTGAIEILNYT